MSVVQRLFLAELTVVPLPCRGLLGVYAFSTCGFLQSHFFTQSACKG